MVVWLSFYLLTDQSGRVCVETFLSTLVLELPNPHLKKDKSLVNVLESLIGPLSNVLSSSGATEPTSQKGQKFGERIGKPHWPLFFDYLVSQAGWAKVGTRDGSSG